MYDCKQTPQAQRLAKAIDSICANDSTWSVCLGDHNLFRRFRALEPELVSFRDEHPKAVPAEWQVLSLKHQSETAGVLSYLVDRNPQKKEQRSHYARIDLVIIHPRYRGLGIGRILVLFGLLQILSQWTPQLYSISCLAAHPAITAILEKLGFQGVQRTGRTFIHQSMALDDHSAEILGNHLIQQMNSSLQICNYRLRQATIGSKNRHRSATEQ